MISKLHKKAFGGILFVILLLAMMVFIPAGSFDYWQAWVFLVVFSSSVFAITIYLMKKDPSLLERRVKAGPGAEKEKDQKVIQWVAQIAFILVFVVSSLDHRFVWSVVVPEYAVAAGDLLVILGFLIVWLVFKENTFTSGTIEVIAEQKVISTGPYRFVRHPMYSGTLILLLGVPLALGSLWGLVTLIPMVIVISWRLLAEERFLSANLPAYSEYLKRVKYRLVPCIW